MSEFKVIETQEQLDSIIKDRLTRAQESVRKEYADYDQLKEQVAGFDAIKSDYETRLKEANEKNESHGSKISELEKTIKRYETNSLKVKIANECGIPYSMAERLKGDDEDSIRQDAKAMAPMLKGNARRQNWEDDEEKKERKNSKAYKELLSGLHLRDE